MAAYFFDEALSLGNTGHYDEERGEFYFDPDYATHSSTCRRRICATMATCAVLVGPDCASRL
jgi:hypothetical protein